MALDTLASRQRQRLVEASSFHAIQALVLAFGCLLVVLGGAIDRDVHPLLGQVDYVPRGELERLLRAWLRPPLGYTIWQASLAGSAAAVVLGGAALLRRPRLGRRVALAGLSLFAPVAAVGVLALPGRALLLLLLLLGVAMRIRAMPLEPSEPLPSDPEIAAHPRLMRGGVVAASVVAFAAWLMVATDRATGPVAEIAALATFGVALAYSGLWLRRTIARESGRGRLVFFASPAILLLAAGSVVYPKLALTWLAVHQLVVLVLVQSRRSAGGVVWLGVVEHPARLLVSTFAVVALAGGVALYLPACTERPGGVALVDAMFTSVSATCVTGLVVLDTPKDFSWLGQLVILLLIQIGGLGIMTFSTAGVLLLGRRLGMRHEIAVGNLLTDEGGGNVYGAARRILATTFSIEAVGALVLAGLFVLGGEDPGGALWRGVFTSVSAFCNAGFALQSDNLITYQHDPAVLHVVALLIIAGGLGTPVIHAVPLWFQRKPVSLQARLVLVTTFVLLVVPFVLIALLEWNHALGHLSPANKLHNAWFQSVVPRTAGFNSVDYLAITPATITLTLLLMFIGGSPFSTAGGVKTTTIALITCGVLAAIRGRTEATAFGRRISHESIYKSIAIMTIGSLFALGGFAAVQLTQKMPYEMGLFEVVSALGTVGLSVGGTMKLDGIGKLIIMACMFAGRVGPITLFLLLTERRREPKWGFPEEKVAVG